MAISQSESLQGLLLYMYSPIIIIILTILLLLLLQRQRNKNLKHVPPSPPKLPIIGNLHMFIGKHVFLHRYLQSLTEKYGPLMLLQLGRVPTLVVSSAEMVEEIVKHHDIAFSDRPSMTALKFLTYGGADFAYAPYGEFWRQAREVCHSHLLNNKMVAESFKVVREEEVGSLLLRIGRASSEGKGKSVVNLSEMMFGTTHKILSRCVIGKEAEEDDGKLIELSKQVVRVFSDMCFGDLFPFFGWVDVLTGLIGRMKATSNGIGSFLDSVIQEKKKKKTTSSGNDLDNDFVQILLRVQQQTGFTHNNLKGILTDIIVGGLDASSSTMEWVMAELLKNPRVMQKAQEEVRRVVGRKGKVEEEDVNQMEYLKCIVKETLRLHPPAPLLIPRATSQSIIKLKGYHISPKTTVLVNLWAIQRDPKLWDEPQAFVPERFETNPINFVGQDFKYIPFGMGRRSCPGMSFAVVLIEFAIANLLYCFDWKLVGDGDADHGTLDMTEVFGIVVFKEKPLQLVPIAYSP